MYLGNKTIIKDGIAISDEYKKIAMLDEESANLLSSNCLYNQAAYFYIQAMEKYIKYQISKKMNIMLEINAENLRRTVGHSLTLSIKLLINVYAGNDVVLAKQMEYQLLHLILNDINFSFLHNNVRYPFYNDKFKNYTLLKFSKNDCDKLYQMLQGLKKYLLDLDRL